MTASASRLLQFAWLSHANDIRFAANGYLTLQARASSTLTGLTARAAGRPVAHDQRHRLKGVLARRRPGRSSRAAQGSGRYETFADATTVGSGRFKVRYRFRSSAARAGTLRLPGPHPPRRRKFPYETGLSSA